eukprot:7853290-Prorocentrum_lima.AAC.1
MAGRGSGNIDFPSTGPVGQPILTPLHLQRNLVPGVSPSLFQAHRGCGLFHLELGEQANA